MQALAVLCYVARMLASGHAVTLHDVARRAGVHPSTVSRTLNRPEMVAEATRDRVLAAVDALGFVPNRAAAHLAGGATAAIGVVVPDIANPYFAALLQSIQAQAADRSNAVLIGDTAQDPDNEARMLASLSERVDGLVVCTPVSDLSAARVPVVQVNRQGRHAPSVVVDQHAVAELATSHLGALGHRHVAYLHGPLRYWSARRRTAAICTIQRTDTHGMRIELVRSVPGTFEGGRDAFAAVAATGATAVIAFNDIQAAGLSAAAADAGVEVPGALSIVGSDGSSVAAMTQPRLTSVAAPTADIARAALDALFSDTPPRRTVLQPTLILGASSAPPSLGSTATTPQRTQHDQPA